jgi:hypothetical protein
VLRIAFEAGNCLTPEQRNALWQAPDPGRLRGKRDPALPASLLARGHRRHEIAELNGKVESSRHRELAGLWKGAGDHGTGPHAPRFATFLEHLS